MSITEKLGKMYCKNCGNEIEESSVYCSKCGYRIKKDSMIRRHQIATILSFFIIGLGQIYNKQILKGITFFIIALIFSILSTDKSIFFLITIIIWIYGMYDANSTAKRKDISITKKLGKMGVPGFRSGKKWKMAVAMFGYLFIFLIFLAIISGPPNTNSTDNQKISEYETILAKRHEIENGLVSRYSQYANNKEQLFKIGLEEKMSKLKRYREKTNRAIYEGSKSEVTTVLAEQGVAEEDVSRYLYYVYDSVEEINVVLKPYGSTAEDFGITNQKLQSRSNQLINNQPISDETDVKYIQMIEDLKNRYPQLSDERQLIEVELAGKIVALDDKRKELSEKITSCSGGGGITICTEDPAKSRKYKGLLLYEIEEKEKDLINSIVIVYNNYDKANEVLNNMIDIDDNVSEEDLKNGNIEVYQTKNGTAIKQKNIVQDSINIKSTPTTVPIENIIYESYVDQDYGFYRVISANKNQSENQFSYVNKTLNINVGDSIIWINDANPAQALTIVSEQNLWSEAFLRWNYQKFNYTFMTTGTYDVYIKENPKFRQKIIVNSR